MSTFHLKVVTADRLFYDDEVERIVVRTTTGDVGILPRHVPYVAALGIGGLTVVTAGQTKTAAIAGGFVQTDADGATVLVRTCEWADEIDVDRARAAVERAKAQLQQSAQDNKLVEAKLKKAINRIRIAGK